MPRKNTMPPKKQKQPSSNFNKMSNSPASPDSTRSSTSTATTRSPPIKPPPTKPLDIPLQDPRRRSDSDSSFSSSCVPPPTPTTRFPPDNKIFDRILPKDRSPSRTITPMTLNSDSKVTEGFDVEEDFTSLPMESAQKKQKKPVMKVAPLLPEDPLPRTKSFSGLSQEENSAIQNFFNLDDGEEERNLTGVNLWSEEEIRKYQEDQDKIIQYQEDQAKAREREGKKKTSNRYLTSLVDCFTAPVEEIEQPKYLVSDEKKWTISKGDVTLDQIFISDTIRGEEEMDMDIVEVSPPQQPAQTVFELSQRTKVTTTNHKMLEFDIGPLEPDPDHVNAVVKFSGEAFQELKTKMGLINQESERILNKTLKKPMKKHLKNQWYVELQPCTLSPDTNFWVNLLTINRQGIKNCKNSVFLKAEEWKKLCSYQQKITQNLAGIKVTLPTEQKQVPKQAMMYKYNNRPKRNCWGETVQNTYFFTPDHALDHIKHFVHDPDLTLRLMELKYGLEPVFVDPPCINNFLLDCFMFYLYTKVCNHHLEMYCVPSNAKVEACQVMGSISTEDVVNFLFDTDKMEFPHKYLQQCFLQYHLNIGLPFPATGSAPYIQSLKKFVRLHHILNQLFYSDGCMNGTIDMEYGTPTHYLRSEVYYMMYPEEKFSKDNPIYKVSENDMFKESY